MEGGIGSLLPPSIWVKGIPFLSFHTYSKRNCRSWSGQSHFVSWLVFEPLRLRFSYGRLLRRYIDGVRFSHRWRNRPTWTQNRMKYQLTHFTGTRGLFKVVVRLPSPVPGTRTRVHDVSRPFDTRSPFDRSTVDVLCVLMSIMGKELGYVVSYIFLRKVNFLLP